MSLGAGSEWQCCKRLVFVVVVVGWLAFWAQSATKDYIRADCKRTWVAFSVSARCRSTLTPWKLHGYSWPQISLPLSPHSPYIVVHDRPSPDLRWWFITHIHVWHSASFRFQEILCHLQQAHPGSSTSPSTAGVSPLGSVCRGYLNHCLLFCGMPSCTCSTSHPLPACSGL